MIVNVSSQTGISLLDGGMRAVYGVAKAGIAYLTRTLAAELGPRGIRVNAAHGCRRSTPPSGSAARGTARP